MKTNLLHYLLPKGGVVFRGRINPSFDLRFYESKALSYNHYGEPKLWRANLPGQAVFYGTLLDVLCMRAEERLYANIVCEISDFFRTKDKLGFQIISLGCWEAKRDIRLVSFPLHDGFKDPSTTLLSLDKQWNQINGKTAYDDSKITEIAKLFASDFSMYAKSDPYVIASYKKTATFTHDLFEQNPDIDGIVYPCTRLDGNGIDVVLKPDVADNDLVLSKILILGLYKIEVGRSRLLPIEMCDDVSNGLVYSELKPEDLKEFNDNIKDFHLNYFDK